MFEEYNRDSCREYNIERVDERKIDWFGIGFKRMKPINEFVVHCQFVFYFKKKEMAIHWFPFNSA